MFVVTETKKLSNNSTNWRTKSSSRISKKENIQLGIPPHIMGTFTPQLRELCGLGVYRGLTGNIDKRSPAEVLYGDPPSRQIWDQEPTGGN